MKRSVFSRSALGLLLASAVALFALSVILHAYDDDPVATAARSRPGTYSLSALGYAGFYDTLRRLDRPVNRSVGNTLAMVGARGTLVVAEPDLEHVSSAEGMKLMGAPRLLLVLPKWSGLPDEERPAWIAQARPLHLDYAKNTLRLVAGRSDVYRRAWPSPAEWKYNHLGFTPTAPKGSGVIQMIRSSELRPVLGTAEGMLVGELLSGNRVIWVLADPDLLANHGLGSGRNAALMVSLLDNLRGWRNSDQGAPIVFDETVHGFLEAEGTPLKLLFRFPFVVITILICGTAILLALAGSSRFGAARRVRPELDFGKRQLIDNGARLLDYGGHHVVTLKRYIRMTVRSAAQAMHAPVKLGEAELPAWLDRIGKSRGVKRSCAAILRRASLMADSGGEPGKNDVKLAGLFDCARDIYLWKGEILHGSSASRLNRK
ncbi:MAG: hypothetical protein LBM64_04490 [Deltaproteobacteria bacterium]|jgi:hypothetical protein|nr:hypothetical protein [Deltaproteobacteria bacterium]